MNVLLPSSITMGGAWGSGATCTLSAKVWHARLEYVKRASALYQDMSPQAGAMGWFVHLTTTATLGFAMKSTAHCRRAAILRLWAYCAATESLAGKIPNANLTLAYLAHARRIRNAKAKLPEITKNLKAQCAFLIRNAKVSMVIVHTSVAFAQQTSHVPLMLQP
jgi:hypothetical protein